MAVPSVRFTNLTLLSPEGLQVRSGRPQTSVYAVVHSVRRRRSAAQRSHRPAALQATDNARFDFIPSTLVYRRRPHARRRRCHAMPRPHGGRVGCS
jgi:hypothetical protein